MNGISSNLKDEIKKSKDTKNKEKIKFIGSILITNILVALLCWTPAKDATTKISQRTIHPTYQMMVLPLNALVTEDSKSLLETPVTLVSKDKIIIAKKAYLHDLVSTNEGSTHFKIEVSDLDLVKVSEFIESGVIAVPYVESRKASKVQTTLKKGSKYEISI